MIIKAGTLLCTETGQYSDFAYAGPFRVLRDIDQKRAVEEFIATWPDNPDSRLTYQRADTGEDDTTVFTKPHDDKFVPWLARQGYIEDVDSFAWYLGCYGFEPEITA